MDAKSSAVTVDYRKPHATRFDSEDGGSPQLRKTASVGSMRYSDSGNVSYRSIASDSDDDLDMPSGNRGVALQKSASQPGTTANVRNQAVSTDPCFQLGPIQNNDVFAGDNRPTQQSRPERHGWISRAQQQANLFHYSKVPHLQQLMANQKDIKTPENLRPRLPDPCWRDPTFRDFPPDRHEEEFLRYEEGLQRYRIYKHEASILGTVPSLQRSVPLLEDEGPIKNSTPTRTDAQERGPPEACVFVANLPQGPDNEKLGSHVSLAFRQFGTVYVKIKRDRNKMPYAFCQFEREEHALRAVAEGRGIAILGRPCRVEMANGGVTFIVYRKDGREVTAGEARRLLQNLGPIAKIEELDPVFQEHQALPPSLLVSYATYDGQRNVLKSFGPDSDYCVIEFDARMAQVGNALRANPEAPNDEIFRQVQEQDKRSVYVGKLPAFTVEAKIRKLCRQFGPIRSVELHDDSLHNGKMIHYAFVEFVLPDSAKQACERLTGYVLKGHYIRCELKRTKYNAKSTQPVTGARVHDPPPDQDGRIITVPLRTRSSETRALDNALLRDPPAGNGARGSQVEAAATFGGPSSQRRGAATSTLAGSPMHRNTFSQQGYRATNQTTRSYGPNHVRDLTGFEHGDQDKLVKYDAINKMAAAIYEKRSPQHGLAAGRIQTQTSDGSGTAVATPGQKASSNYLLPHQRPYVTPQHKNTPQEMGAATPNSTANSQYLQTPFNHEIPVTMVPTSDFYSYVTPSPMNPYPYVPTMPAYMPAAAVSPMTPGLGYDGFYGSPYYAASVGMYNQQYLSPEQMMEMTRASLTRSSGPMTSATSQSTQDEAAHQKRSSLRPSINDE